MVLVGPVLWNDLSPIISFPTYFLFVSTVFFLLMTQCSDPGIIPRKDIIKIINDTTLEKYVQRDDANVAPVDGT